MKTLFFALLLSAFYNLIYAQSSPNSKIQESQRFQNNQSITTKTLVINTTNYSLNTFREFKKELRGWSGIVLSSKIDTIQHTFTLTHNALLDKQELEEFLNKYQIKKSNIISYQ